MSTDYSKMKNAELEALLKSRNLPHTGKKADMVQRLQDADKKPASSDVPAATTKAAAPIADEDEIDWDDDEPTTTTKPVEPATTAPAAAAVTAGGQGPVANSTPVSNQVAAIDPAKTNDLSVKKPDEDTSAAPVGEEAKAVDEPKEEKLKVDYSRHLALATVDEEIEKRKKRAAKFGLDISADEELKRLERAKKFGQTEGLKGVNEALPDRPLGRKRGREGDDGGRSGDKRRGGRFDGRGGRGPRGGDRGDRKPQTARPQTARPETARTKSDKNSDGGPTWMNEADRAKAEARKAKFSAPAA